MAGRQVVVVGAGLAGSEAAWQLAERGLDVLLWEMRPAAMTPAHRTGYFAELVCSNSLGSEDLGNATGLLKAELREMGSLLLEVAAETRLPAGRALAVDRLLFSRGVHERLLQHAKITVIPEALTSLPDEGLTVVATGPLTSDSLAAAIAAFTGAPDLHFYDAVAPVVVADSIDPASSFWGARYDGGGTDDYLNCPLSEPEYDLLWQRLCQAPQHPIKDFERGFFYEGCLPVEELARRGRDTLRYGPLKPVGLVDPRTGERPFAVCQLRREDAGGQLFNVVGFQTNLTYEAQKDAFRTIPALREAEFVRLGMMHRNTYLNAPAVLSATLEAKARHGLFFAGQLTGAEGYAPAIATGMAAALAAVQRSRGLEPRPLPAETMIGALCHHLSQSPSPDFQPMGVNWGLMPRLPARVKRLDRPACHTARSLPALKRWIADSRCRGAEEQEEDPKPQPAL